MSRIRRFSALGAAVVFWAALAVADAGLDSVEKTIADLAGKIASYSAVIDMTSGTSGQVHGTGTLECLKKDETFLYRMELSNKDEHGKEHKILGVFDGTNLYSQTDVMGQMMVVKMKPALQTDIVAYGGPSMFERLHKNFETKLLPEEEVNGKPAYAFEATPKPGPPANKQQAAIGKIVLCFAKDTGIQVKEVTYDKSGAALMTITYREIKLDANPTPERFTYSPPPGAKVLNGEDLRKIVPHNEPPRAPSK